MLMFFVKYLNFSSEMNFAKILTGWIAFWNLHWRYTSTCTAFDVIYLKTRLGSIHVKDSSSFKHEKSKKQKFSKTLKDALILRLVF